MLGKTNYSLGVEAAGQTSIIHELNLKGDSRCVPKVAKLAEGAILGFLRDTLLTLCMCVCVSGDIHGINERLSSNLLHLSVFWQLNKSVSIKRSGGMCGL